MNSAIKLQILISRLKKEQILPEKMGAVADCCSTREIDQRKEGDENQPGILTPISQENGVNAKDEATFREHLWHKWR